MKPRPPLPPPPDVHSFNACIAACRRGGQPGLARLLFREMLSRDLRPDVRSFVSMLFERLEDPSLAGAVPVPAAAAVGAAVEAVVRGEEGEGGMVVQRDSVGEREEEEEEDKEEEDEAGLAANDSRGVRMMEEEEKGEEEEEEEVGHGVCV